MANYSKDRLILVTNDDAYDAPGIAALTEVAARYGRVVVVAPKEPQSGKSQAITTTTPLFLDKISECENVQVYALTGTPVDCVKFATDHLLKSQRIDLVLSGINHGSNAAINVLYSGTMGAAIESSMYVAPSIGFSHLNHSLKIDLEAAKYYADQFVGMMLDAEPKGHVCWNVNIPDLPLDQIKGVKVVRQNRGYWLEEFYERKDPRGREYYWLTGDFVNTEPEATDTDIAALEAGYVSVVPIQVDMTAYDKMDEVAAILGV